MPGRLRRKSVDNARHELTFKQDNFEGQNIDHPASELGTRTGSGYASSILARIEDAICRGKFIEPRKGTRRFSYAKLPGSGIVYCGPIQHPTTQKFIVHRGTQLWVSDNDANFWEALSPVDSSTSIPGEYSDVAFFEDDFVFCTKSGIFLTDIAFDNRNYILLNSPCPCNRIMDDPTPDGGTQTNIWSTTFTGDSSSNLTLNESKSLYTGLQVRLSTDGTLPLGLSTDTDYYVIADPADTGSLTVIRLATSADGADAGEFVTLEDTGTGTHTITPRTNYEYRYFFTFTRLLSTTHSAPGSGSDRRNPNITVIHETGTKRVYGSKTRDWGTIRTNMPINEENPATINMNFSEDFETTAVSTADDEITVLNEYDTGMVIRFSTDGTLPNGLSADTNYWVINTTGGATKTIQVATSLDNALAGTEINIIDTGSGTHTITVTVNRLSNSAINKIGVYRTLNIMGSYTGSPISGIPGAAVDPVTGEGNNAELASWVGDVDDDSATFVDGTADDKLRAEIARGAFLAKMRGFEPLPNGDVGKITDGWFFVAERDDPKLNYSSLSELQKSLIGHYNALQFHKFDQGIQKLTVIEDTLITALSNQTKPVTLTSFRNEGLLEFVPILDHFPDGDKTLGVLDYGTIAEVEQGTIIAVCSDHSVRLWDGTRWGDDLSHDLVNTEIRKMLKGSVAAYFAGRYYLWYRTDETVAYNNKCLRLGLKKEAGFGWSFCTGDEWIYPPLYTGATLIQDKNGIQRLIVLDHKDGYMYWLDTFDSFSGSNLSESYADKQIDGGFCPLGSKYWYDEMDNNSVSGDLAIGTVGSGAATEVNGYMRLSSDEFNSDKVRVLRDKTINTGDIDISVRHTHQDSVSGTMYWELKAADFTADDDQIDIDDLNQGFLAYVEGKSDGSGTYVAHWKFLAGSTSVDSSVVLSGRPQKLQIKRDTNTLSVYADDKYITANTNAVWGTLSGLKASFSYDGNTGSGAGAGESAGFNAFYVVSDQMDHDCLGTDGLGSQTVDSPKRISSLLRFMQISGIEESHNVKHRESHSYFRPTTLTSFHPAFEVDWKMYQDGGTTPIETVTNVKYSGDIQNWRDIEGRTIQPEINTNLSKWKMVGFDSHYWSEDKRDLDDDPGSTEEADWQEELATDLVFWAARRDYTLDRATGNTILLYNGSYIVGPDSDAKGGITGYVSEGSPWLFSEEAYPTLTDFTVAMWVKGMPNAFFKYGYGSSSMILYLSVNYVKYYGSGMPGTSSIPTDINDADAWHFVVASRSGSTVSLYVDARLYGTASHSNSISGSVVGAQVINSASAADIRVFSKALTADAITYAYNQVREGGDKILPL